MMREGLAAVNGVRSAANLLQSVILEAHRSLMEVLVVLRMI